MSVDFRLKIAALLHDPPNKPWLLVHKVDHEAEAAGYVRSLAGLDEIPEEVRRADQLASSIDRHILSILMGGRYVSNFLPCERLELRNPVNPLFRVELPAALGGKQLSDFKNTLFSLLGNIPDARLRYLLLYALYEVLWIDHGLPVGPADTRVPTHTVFDHNYATAAALNWVSGHGVKGLLVGIDVAGVQGFISSSRKLRDAWVSSYLVSALVWYSILPLVREIGPDVLVTPSLRLNPFFVHWLAEGLASGREERVNESIRESLRVAESYVYLGDEHLLKLKEKLGIPPYASIPERATLILPDGVERVLNSAVDEFLEYRFRKGWIELWKALKVYADERASKDGRLLWVFVSRVFDYYNREFSDARFHDTPPLTVRVEVVRVNQSAPSWEVYDRAYTELAEKLAARKYLRVTSEAELRLDVITERAFSVGLGFPSRSSRGFEYCTSCGRLPALLVLPSGEGERPEDEEYGFYVFGAVEKGWGSDEIGRRWRELREAAARGEESQDLKQFESWLERQGVPLRSLKVVFTPGERLCPWCFAKRVLSLEPRLLNLLLLGMDSGEEFARSLISDSPGAATRFGFPSTADVASLRLRERLVRAAREGGLGVVAAEALISQSYDFLKAALSESRLWRAEAELEKEIESLGVGEELKILLKGLLKADAETLWLTSDARTRAEWAELLRRLGVASYLWSYYVLLAADGDSIGKLLGGEASALLGVEEEPRRSEKLMEELLKAWGACDLGRLIAALMVSEEESWSSALREWSRVLADQLGESPEAVEQRLRIARSLVIAILRRGRVPLSISHHFSVSSALSRIAVLDAVIVSKLGGFVIYAGGDDLLAFLPVDAAGTLIYASRRLFAGAPLDQYSARLLSGRVEVAAGEGFLRIKNAWLPALPGVGRSYSALIAHFLYPLHLSIQRAASSLESAKSEVRVRRRHGGREDELLKDVAAFVYAPRGGMEMAFVPQTLDRCIHIAEGLLTADCYLKQVAETVKAVDELLRAVVPELGQRIYSTSLLYDVESVNKHLTEAAQRHDRLVSQLVDFVMRRNLARGRRETSAGGGVPSDLIQRLCGGEEKFATCIVECRAETSSRDSRKAHLFTAIVRSTRLLRGGVR